MHSTVQKTNPSQSDSFMKLRRKMQNQMKKNHVDYHDILKIIKEEKK
ncbi:hypothetical protein [Virgibacillus phasianinus]|nr:hypothetical protein [Virgibacillus phasianinus]